MSLMFRSKKMELNKTIMRARRLSNGLSRRNNEDTYFKNDVKSNEMASYVKDFMPEWSDLACIEMAVLGVITPYRHEDLYNEKNELQMEAVNNG